MVYAKFQTKVLIRAILDKLEVQLRKKVILIMEQKVGIDWWSKSVPKNILNKCNYWQKSHKSDPFRIGEVKNAYEYMAMGHLLSIMNSNSNLFNDMFNEETLVYLKQIVNLRDSLSHPTDILIDDIKGCKIALRGILEQLKDSDLEPSSIIQQFNSCFIENYTLPVHNLPAAPFSDFFGREDDIEFIENELIYHPNTWLLLIDGIGGIGKSSLAFWVARYLIKEIESNSSEFEHVLWLSAKTNKLTFNFDVEEQEPDFDCLEMLLDSFLDFFKVEPVSLTLSEKKEKVNEVLEMTKCLIIVDNLETISDNSIYSFFDRIPSHNKILLTSRDRRYKLLEGKGLQIEGLKEDESISLIKSKAEKNNITSLINTSDEILKQLHKKTFGHPLILECLLHQIYSGKSVEQVLVEIENTDLMKVFDFCFGTTYNMLDFESQKILICLAIFNKPITTKELRFVCELNESVIYKCIEQLKMFSLVKEKVEKISSMFYLLPVIARYASYQMNNQKTTTAELMKRYGVYQEQYLKIEELTQNEASFLKKFNFVNDFDKLAASLANSALNEYYQTGNYQGTIEAINSALNLSENSAYICQIRALIEKNEGYYGEAAKWYDKAVSNDSSNALLWRLWGDLEKEFPNYQRAYEKYFKATDLDPLDKRAWFGLGYCQSQLAKNFWEKHQFNSHESYRLEADKSFEKSLYENPETKVEKVHNAKVYHQKGFNLFHLQKYEDVIKCCNEGLKFDYNNQHLKNLLIKAKNKL